MKTQQPKTYAATAAKSLQSCPILCDPIDGSPPGSAILGILQAKTLEWVAISFSNMWLVATKSDSADTAHSIIAQNAVGKYSRPCELYYYI